MLFLAIRCCKQLSVGLPSLPINTVPKTLAWHSKLSWPIWLQVTSLTTPPIISLPIPLPFHTFQDKSTSHCQPPRHMLSQPFDSPLCLPPAPTKLSGPAPSAPLPGAPSRSQFPSALNPHGPPWCLIPWGLLDWELSKHRVRPIHLCVPGADSGCPVQAWWKNKDPLSGLFLKEESVLEMCENANSRLCSFLLLKKTIIRCLISPSSYNRVPKGCGKSLWKK